MKGKDAAVLLLFAAAALAWTWPLPLHWWTGTPGSQGDPLLLMWTMAWDLHALHHHLPLFDANIFHPSPGSLAFSDHLLGELPVFALGRLLGWNVLASYNLTFVTMVALNGFCAYLLGRDLSGSRPAGVLAGTVYAFAPMRLSHLDHLAFQATAGYPLALWLWNLNKVGTPTNSGAIGTPRRWKLENRAGLGGCPYFLGALAWQALCGGYHAVYVFGMVPFLAAVLVARGRPVRAPLLAWGAAMLVVSPSLLPYLRMKSTIGQISGAVPEWGAGLLSALTAPHADRLWGWTCALWGRGLNPEAMLFPGAMAAIAACHGMRARLGTAPAASSVPPATSAAATPTPTGCLRGGLRALDATLVLLAAWMVWIQVTGGGVWHLGGIRVQARTTGIPTSVFMLLGIARLALDPGMRGRLRRALKGAEAAPVALATLGAAAFLFSFYVPATLLGHLLPGFGSLRVPARLSLLALLAVAAFAAWGAARWADTGQDSTTFPDPDARRRTGTLPGRRTGHRTRRPPVTRAQAWIAVAILAAFVEGLGTPLPISAPLDARDALPAPAAVLLGKSGDVYRWLASAPHAVVAELPTPRPDYDLFYEWASTLHWKPLVNGSSGYSPRYYDAVRDTLEGFPSRASLDTLRALGATEVVVHFGFVPPERRAALERVVAAEPTLRPRARFGDDAVYALAEPTGASPPPSPRRAPAGPAPAQPAADQHPPPGPEIPRGGWRASASIDPNPLGTVRFLVDGNPATHWSTERPQQAGDSVTVDMGAPQDVEQIRLELGGHCSDYPRDFRVEASTDGEDWRTVARQRVDAPPLAAYFMRPLDPWIDIPFPRQHARWLRVVLDGSARAFWCVAEIRAYR